MYCFLKVFQSCFSCSYFFHASVSHSNTCTFGHCHFVSGNKVRAPPPPQSECPQMSAYLYLLFLGADTTSLGLWPRSWKCSDAPNKKQGWSKHTGKNIIKKIDYKEWRVAVCQLLAFLWPTVKSTEFWSTMKLKVRIISKHWHYFQEQASDLISKVWVRKIWL